MATKTEAVAELESAYKGFRAQVAGLPEAAWSERWLGTWTLGELLAHMAGWWNEMVPAFGRVKRGERPTPEGVDYSDPDPFNARFTVGAPSGAGALAAWDAAFNGYIGAARDLPEDFYGTNDQGRPKIGNRLLQGAGVGHFEEHRGQLDSWIAGRK